MISGDRSPHITHRKDGGAQTRTCETVATESTGDDSGAELSIFVYSGAEELRGISIAPKRLKFV
jgi:hypothetical protein